MYCEVIETNSATHCNDCIATDLLHFSVADFIFMLQILYSFVGFLPT